MCQPVTRNLHRRRLRSAVRGDLIVPSTRTVHYGPHSLAVAGPSTWNALPAPLRNYSLPAVTFRRQLKITLCYTVPLFWKRLYRDNFVISRHKSKRIAFLESTNFYTCAIMQTFNFRDDHVTTYRHPSGEYICQIMSGHRLFRLARGTPSVSWLSIGTIGLG